VRPYLLHHLLEDAAATHGDRPAVVDGDRTITYAELEERSGRVAALLTELGVEPGGRVGLYLDKSMEALVGLHAILRAGAAYVPLDPAAPTSRLGYIAQNCELRVLLTGQEKADRWGALMSAGAPVEALVVLNGPAPSSAASDGPRVLGSEAIEAATPTPQAGGSVIDEDLAYILYTSGSTGVPKGVMLSHRNALSFVRWAAELISVRPEDRLSSHAPLHFDLSVFEIFAAAAAGAAVCVVRGETALLPAEMARFIGEHGITVWYSVPSALTLLVTRGGLRGGEFPDLRAVIFAGEVFPTKHLRRLMEVLPHPRYYNWYGPTETNVCTWYPVAPLPEDQNEPIPIGRPVDNLEVVAVTDDGRRAGSGEEGELYVRGAAVMQGYWGLPDQTARALVPDPLERPHGGPMYRTGDLVRVGEDGDFRFLGRRDAQIKSRGYRIELGEIEAALYAHSRVAECAVTAVPDDVVTNRILAYVVLRDDVDAAELARFCAERLPRYMVPERFEFRESLPKTSTGKIDRRALDG
jgi:amino acid adenylation domain-containing protein